MMISSMPHRTPLAHPLTRLIGRPDLQLHKVRLWILALGARCIRRVDILPTLLPTHDVVDFLALELGTARHLLLDGEVVGARRACPFVLAELILGDEEDVGACWAEEHRGGMRGGVTFTRP